jgi:hypothetical protein
VLDVINPARSPPFARSVLQMTLPLPLGIALARLSAVPATASKREIHPAPTPDTTQG